MKQIICFGILLLWLVPRASAISIATQSTTEAYSGKKVSAPLFEKPSLFKVWKIRKALRAYRGKDWPDAEFATAFAWLSLFMGVGGIFIFFNAPLLGIVMLLVGLLLALLGNYINKKSSFYSSTTRAVSVISMVINGVPLLILLALIIALTISYSGD